jgi:hypothetical protein
MFDEKAQLHTLEGVAAATLLLLVIIYAIDATSMTPLTASTSSIHSENELTMLGQDILNTLDYSDPGYSSNLKNDILSWDGREYIWNGSGYIAKDGNDPPLSNNLTGILNATLIKRGISHNVMLTYLDNSTHLPITRNMIYDGDPSNNAVIVSRKIVLRDTGYSIGGNGDDNDGEENPNNPILDIDPSTNLYNIVDVKLVLWRM